MCFDWLRSPESPSQHSQPLSVLTAESHGALAQIPWRIVTGGEKSVCQRICTKNLFNYVLYQECSIALASKVFFERSKNVSAYMLLVLNRIWFFLSSEIILNKKCLYMHLSQTGCKVSRVKNRHFSFFLFWIDFVRSSSTEKREVCQRAAKPHFLHYLRINITTVCQKRVKVVFDLTSMGCEK